MPSSKFKAYFRVTKEMFFRLSYTVKLKIIYMKTKFIISFFILLFVSCSSKKNDATFIAKTTGRYFFNEDEIIEVFFENEELFLKWRNTNLKPLKINDSTFYAKELDEKLIFVIQEEKIKLAPKREHKDEKYEFLKLQKGEKTPSEYVEENNFEEALKGYLAIQKRDSLNPVIRERKLNSYGYSYLKNNEFEKAITVFKINTQLYPNSSNTFDSLGDAYFKQKDTAQAIVYYKKALSINPENRSSKRNLKKLTKD